MWRSVRPHFAIRINLMQDMFLGKQQPLTTKRVIRPLDLIVSLINLMSYYSFSQIRQNVNKIVNVTNFVLAVEIN